ncbi:MAG: hypothetical protein CMK37_08315 [Porticoccaceae bacterium]|nr:hypothetical protein [Porticoccaceae bacterium]|tara:strand:- start:7047 stop:8783 length:1737 start_codon:yes stop_codon:yes gene_type:complete
MSRRYMQSSGQIGLKDIKTFIDRDYYHPGAVAVNGYYPLYTSASAANANQSGNGSSHTHVFGSTTYYMPDGLTMGTNQFHGDLPTVSYSNISLGTLFTEAQNASPSAAELPNGNFTAPHSMSEFLDAYIQMSSIEITSIAEAEWNLAITMGTGGSSVTGASTYGHQVTANITATPSTGYGFVNWTGATVADANSASTTILMDGDKNLTANFSVQIFTFMSDIGVSSNCMASSSLSGHKVFCWPISQFGVPGRENVLTTGFSDTVSKIKGYFYWGPWWRSGYGEYQSGGAVSASNQEITNNGVGLGFSAADIRAAMGAGTTSDGLDNLSMGPRYPNATTVSGNSLIEFDVGTTSANSSHFCAALPTNGAPSSTKHWYSDTSDPETTTSCLKFALTHHDGNWDNVPIESGTITGPWLATVQSNGNVIINGVSAIPNIANLNWNTMYTASNYNIKGYFVVNYTEYNGSVGGNPSGAASNTTAWGNTTILANGVSVGTPASIKAGSGHTSTITFNGATITSGTNGSLTMSGFNISMPADVGWYGHWSTTYDPGDDTSTTDTYRSSGTNTVRFYISELQYTTG